MYKHIPEEYFLRQSDFISFLEEKRRLKKCPHCEHSGAWEFHVMTDPETGEAEEDPVLVPYLVPVGVPGEEPEPCIGITCPECGHWALISMYKIRSFLNSEAQNRG